MSMDRLIENIIAKQNPTVVGLDPKLSYIPKYIQEQYLTESANPLEGAAAAIFHFNKRIIDAVCDIVPAVKPQCAYYELYGWPGMKALADTIDYAKQRGMFVITDGKRNDIGTTMEAYAAAHLGEIEIGGAFVTPFDGDALTVNGYLGSDGITPLLEVCKHHDKGIFVLVKTSNPSSGELQNLTLTTGDTVYGTMGKMCEAWGKDTLGKQGYSAVGAVVGATYPAQLEELRTALPTTFFLVPGYGAQGGGVQDVLPAFDKKGLGAIINNSRGILCAYQKQGRDEEEFADAAREEALKMRDALLASIGTIG